jgi:hypothetical protein
MPSSEAILAGAATIANQWRAAAIAWHVVLAVVMVAILLGWRPSNRGAAYALSVPFFSVGGAAWAWGNPFNGTVFATLFLLLLTLAKRVSKNPVRFGPPIVAIPGAMLVAFGSGYPHFLETHTWITYAYAAPFGVLPCPTLSVVIGATLLCRLLGSAPWSIALVTAGLVYGAVGVVGLGVQLDYVLVAGALVLLGALRSFTSSSTSRQSAPFGRRSSDRRGAGRSQA